MEKRRSPRYNVSIAPIGCTKETHADANITVCNISSDGIGVSLDKKLAVGDKLPLRIVLPDDGIPMFIIGKIKWIIGAKNCDLYDAGVQLVEINPMDKRRLANYICSKFIVIT
ncbi:MAG: PilZ domain-containing protein [Candidatus Omnitrophica bacterium]|nr:PilZ domain-containing protein [Candidatus Omnitrophota bacterium]